MARDSIELENLIIDSDDGQSNINDHVPNRPPLHKFFAVCFGFIVFGLADASLGPLVVPLEEYYSVGHSRVALAFLCAFAGYLVSALLSDAVHKAVGRRGASVIGVACQFVCFSVASCAPPLWILISCYAVAGIGNGLLEASWNTWAGVFDNANEVLAWLHASYGAGGILSPTIETWMLARGFRWNQPYYVLMAVAFASLVNVAVAFHDETREEYAKYIAEEKKEEEEAGFEDLELGSAPERGALARALRSGLVWLAAVALFAYVGSEVSIGGWVTLFFIKQRGGDPARMGYVATGFWGGMTVGRVVLGYVNQHFFRGVEARAQTGYLVCALVFLGLFGVVRSLVPSAVFVALAGVAMGPLYPTAVVVLMDKMPKALHIAGLGVSTAFGGVGAALVPYTTGALATAVGPWVLVPIATGLMVFMLVAWLVIVNLY